MADVDERLAPLLAGFAPAIGPGNAGRGSVQLAGGRREERFATVVVTDPATRTEAETRTVNLLRTC